MNLATWRVQFPEFASVTDGMVQVYLDAALLEIDLAVWGSKSDQGHGYLAAHKLTLSPYGQAARLSQGAKNGTPTTYWVHYSKLVAQVACGRGRVC